jgi:TPR repeat protein
MRAAGKIALLFVFTVAIATGWFGWHMRRIKVRAAKRAEWLDQVRTKAEHGDPVAEAELGYLYENGKGVPLNYTTAFDWYWKSANQGSADGEGALGSMYYYGRGVPIDHTTAWNWYSKAAAQGNAYAENAAGILLHHGSGTTQDDAQALRWFQKAADQRYANGEYNLGRMYWYGYGALPNRSEAYRWIRRAADDGDEDAKLFLSLSLSRIHEITLLILFVFGLALMANLLTNYLVPKERRERTRRNSDLTIGGICVFSAAYSWYGYTHHLMRRIGAGMNAFTVIRWIIDAAVVLSLIYILRSEKRKQDEMDSAVQDSA